jgi:uncharacterized repeat protein (TIGR01451 family)
MNPFIQPFYTTYSLQFGNLFLSKPLVFTCILLLFCHFKGFALSAGAVSITPVTDTLLVLDSNSPCSGPRAAYIGFKVTNTSGGTLNNLEVTLSNFATGFALSGGQVAKQFIGTLANGASDAVYWYVSYPCVMNSINNFSVTVNDASPGAVSVNQKFYTTSSISAAAGGELASQTVTGVGTIGKIIYMDVAYTFGGAAVGDRHSLQPAGNTSFNAGCYQLLNSKIMSSGVTAIPVNTEDKIFFIATAKQTGSGFPVTVRYFFQANCLFTNTTAQPYAAQTSGSNNIKYSPSYGATTAVTLSEGTTIGFDVTKTVSNPSPYPGDVVTYKVTIKNTTATPSMIERIVDSLPVGFVFGTTLGASDINATNASQMPALGASGNITWSGFMSGGSTGIPFPYKSFYILANDSLELWYTVTTSATGGIYTNSVKPSLNSTNVDTARVSVDTRVYSLSGTVFNDIDALTDGIIDGTGTNAGGLYAILIKDNVVQGSTPVAAGGVFSFSTIKPANYTVILSTTAGSLTANVPATWTIIGEDCCDNTGSDGTIDGSVAVSVTSSNITNINFGINQCGTLSTIITATESSCTADDNTILSGATVNLSASGIGTFTWNNSLGSGASKSVTPSLSTTYIVTLTDGSGCVTMASKTINVIATPTTTISATEASCAVNDNKVLSGASVSLSASGTGIFTWDNSLGSGASKSVTPSATLTYNVTITDANGCTATANKTITIVTAPAAVIAETDASCTANDNIIISGASANLTASGGTSYAWDNSLPASAGPHAVLPTATTTYNVTVTDANGCTATANKTVTIVSAPTAVIAETDASCTPNDNIIISGASANLIASGGTSYAWDNGLTAMAGPHSVSPTATTTYNVTVTDDNGCTATANKTITVDILTLSSVGNINPTTAACPTLNNGNINITASGSNLEYSINNGTTWQVSNTFNSLIAGSYTLKIRNTATTCEMSYTSNPVVLTAPTCVEICDDGIDNDGNGLIDCFDMACKPIAPALIKRQ